MPEVVIATPPAPALTKLDFLKRFTFDERVAIETAAETDPMVRVVKESFKVSEEIRIDDPEMVAGMALYVAKGLITEERKIEILS